jgi:hypothetical protein
VGDPEFEGVRVAVAEAGVGVGVAVKELRVPVEVAVGLNPPGFVAVGVASCDDVGTAVLVGVGVAVRVGVLVGISKPHWLGRRAGWKTAFKYMRRPLISSIVEPG